MPNFLFAILLACTLFCHAMEISDCAPQLVIAARNNNIFYSCTNANNASLVAINKLDLNTMQIETVMTLRNDSLVSMHLTRQQALLFIACNKDCVNKGCESHACDDSDANKCQ